MEKINNDIIISIVENPDIFIPLGGSYYEFGAFAYHEPTNSVLAVDIIDSTVDTDIPGVYTVTYEAEYDGTFNTATRNITVYGTLEGPTVVLDEDFISGDVFARVVDGRYLITNFKVGTVKDKDFVKISFEAFGEYRGKYLYVLGKKVFTDFHLFTSSGTIPIFTVTDHKFTLENSSYHLEVHEFKLKKLMNFLGKLHVEKWHPMNELYLTPFRRRLKKYPKSIYLEPASSEGELYQLRGLFSEICLRMQKLSTTQNLKKILDSIGFIKNVEFSGNTWVISLKKYNRYNINTSSVEASVFKGIVQDFFNFVSEELLEMSFKKMELVFEE